MSDDMPEQQDGEEMSHDSEDGGPGSPREGLDSPCELKSEEKEPKGSERVTCTNCPDSNVTAVLSSRELWQLFDAIGTEMIVTRRGRRMFPAIKVELYDLKPDVSYILLMDMAPVDKYRYKYNAVWVRCFEEECAPTRLYIHPDSPALGAHWTSVVINFYKLKLTNNQLDKQGHIIVNSMHRYQPRLHIVESDDINSFNWETRQTFIFPGTQFTTVTAYQNDKITQLKIQTNPFAKGFRTPFSRCRSRNPPGTSTRLTLPSSSCSDSGVEDPPHPSPSSLSHSSPTSLFSPRLILPSHDSPHFLMQGHDSTRLVVPDQDTPRLLVPGWDLQRLALPQQVILPEQDKQRLILAGQDGKPVLLPRHDGKTHLIAGQGGQRIILSGHDGQKVLVAGQKLTLPTTNVQFSLPAQQEAQVTKLILGCDGQKMLLPAQNGQKVLQGQTIVRQNQDRQKLILAGQDQQAYILSGQDSQKVFVMGAREKTLPSGTSKKRQRTEENPLARKLARLSAPTASEPPMVLMYQPVLANQPQLLSKAVLQPHSSHSANSTAYTLVTAPREPHTSSSLPNVSTTIVSSSRTLSSAPRILTASPIVKSMSHTPSPPSTQAPTTSSPTVVNGLVHLKSSEPKPTHLITSSEMKKPAMDISCLTKEGVARIRTPPPLLQVQKKAAQKATDTGLQSSTDTRETSYLSGDVQQSPTQTEGRHKTSVAVTRTSLAQQENQVVLVQASPPNAAQQEKGAAVPQSQLVLPVAYDQQLVSMPIYRVGSSLGGLQPVQLLTYLPTGAGGGSITTA